MFQKRKEEIQSKNKGLSCAEGTHLKPVLGKLRQEEVTIRPA